MTISTDLLRGSKTRLAALADDDFAVLTAWHEDAGFNRLFDTRPASPMRSDEVKDFYGEMLKSKNDYVFAVRPLEGESLLGVMMIDGIQWAHRAAGMAYAIGAPANRGQGYGTDAVRLGLRFAFNELNLYRLTVTVFSYNAASLALAKKLGFTHEGTWREFFQRDGQRWDMLFFGLLRPEWEAMQGADD
ncbi:MAG: GNAT family N-acetyltransferase [Anaerolineae bacterium]|nr:GNAT family N-acetyltransferase [Anaerolineae bacterium]